LPPTEAGQVLATPTLKPLAQSRPSPGNIYLTMYPDTAPQFGSREVRQAMNWAIDKTALGSCVFTGRCPRAEARCRQERPPMSAEGDRSFACFYPIS
jgi:ABC-type transport system substrate-binding protein